MKQTRPGIHAVKQSIFLDVYGFNLLMNGTGPTRRKAMAMRALPKMETMVGYLIRSQIWENGWKFFFGYF
jgi:hypothetical protein